jgi:multidrug resistance protein
MIHYNTHDEYLSGFVVSVYVLGYAFGPLLVSPLAELYGRVPLYHACNILFTICTLRCAYAGSLRDLAILRFFAGVGGSSVFALVPSSVADMIVKEKRGGVFASITLAYNLGPAVSPTAGAYINDALGWKWIFYITAISGGGVTLLSLLCLRETYDVTLLRRKAKRERKRTGNTHERSRLDIDSNTSRPKEIGRAILMPVRLLAMPSIFLVSLITAVGYGWMYILYITLPTTFIEEYGWARKKLGLAYLGVAVGNLIGMAIGFGVSDAIVKRRAAKGDVRPENRLVPMRYLWPLVGVGLVIYGWTAEKNTHWIGPMIGTGVFSVGAMSAIVSSLHATSQIPPLTNVRAVLHRHIHRRRVPQAQRIGHGRLVRSTLACWWSCAALRGEIVLEVWSGVGVYATGGYCDGVCAGAVDCVSVW